MIKCKLRNKDFKNLNALSAHVTKSHKDITQQYYYIVLWKYEDLQNWIDSNFELRCDY